VVHVQLSKHAHRLFCDKVEAVVSACRQRLAWLKAGSRELFGTLLENKIVIVVDTSVSMAGRLDILKERLQQLLKVYIHYNSQPYYIYIYIYIFAVIYVYIIIFILFRSKSTPRTSSQFSTSTPVCIHGERVW